MQNALTKTEAKVVDMVHHGLRGMAIKEAAIELGVTEHAIRKHLRNAEAKAPNLFPILTQTQAMVLHLYSVEGLSVAEIAAVRKVSVNSIRGMLTKLRKKGALHKRMKHGRPVSFDEATHSNKIIAKW